ncbi:putative bacteriocin export ABC transporter [Bacillus sp. NTK071]|uniref:putative bacteriocin export ABC transporter n=1 Tax=Bacillus sp. NTK071 TaxID=2802175 RepID=UPI001A9060B5|nr:putative bacteriocin export ABC transporter [Bacillus sp. NTK071]MBN8210544.1 putative bacteriocin export ABC transporter [Bacillus sp. NTK071]
MEIVCELSNVTKSYKNHVVIRDLSMTVERDEMLAITGKSGTGKTTLLNMIGMLEKQDEGRITVLGKDYPLSGSQRNFVLREKISYLFQNYALIENATINDNLDIPLLYSKKSKSEKQKVKKEVLERVGLDLSLKQNIHELSGGEQQRVAIARLLLKPGELLLADEPTGSLDAKNRDEIMSLLKEINNEGQTVIIVTHDPAVTQYCDRIVDLSHSEVNTNSD